jgi:hypothetical protein
MFFTSTGLITIVVSAFANTHLAKGSSEKPYKFALSARFQALFLQSYP